LTMRRCANEPAISVRPRQQDADGQPTILDVPAQSLRAREGECELGTLAIGKRCQERISATGWAW